MSNFIAQAKNPRTGLKQKALYCDTGREYKVYFNQDGSDYDLMQSGKKKTYSFYEKELNERK